MRGVKVGLSTWRVFVCVCGCPMHDEALPHSCASWMLCFMSACARQENVSCPANLLLGVQRQWI